MTTIENTHAGSRAAELGVATAHDGGFSWQDPRWLTDHAALERRCRVYLEELRWPDGVHCPRCGSDETGRLEERKKFYCRSCRYQFSVTAGTVFHNTHLPLWKWFLAVSTMLASPTGVPSNQLVQLLGGSYKTAWFVLHRVRTAVRETASAGDGHTPARFVREAVAARLADPRGRDARLFDRPVVGGYRQLSVKHAGAYAAEMEWRAKCRGNSAAFRDTILRLLAAEPLEFEQLIAGPTPCRSRVPGFRADASDAVLQDR